MAERRRAEERRMHSVDEGGMLPVEDLISGTCSLTAALQRRQLTVPPSPCSARLAPTETSQCRTEASGHLSGSPRTASAHHCEATRREHLPNGGCATSTYPRWLTSQKDELDVSGITSIPELRYPAWLRDCDVDSQTSSHETDTSTKRAGAAQSPQSRPKYPEWLKDLDISGLTNVANEEPVSEDLRSLASLEELLSRARMELESPGLEAPSPGSFNTDVFLGADRPWENPSTPLAVYHLSRLKELVDTIKENKDGCILRRWSRFVLRRIRSLGPANSWLLNINGTSGAVV
uniref:Uncharacterized protein LOC116937913 n=1 Tax=Petromyzon marinus TaxID=7757 RepID=A0AAJ7SKT7_PETMA|nr:uncharacterized protein LOC116937913 [Petromyzon marinus]